MRGLGWLVGSACGLLLWCGVVVAEPYPVDARTLLLDHLDDAFTPDGKLCTRPAKITATGDLTGGRPTAGRFGPGCYGQALQMHGLMQMVYPAAGNLDPAAGQVDFDVAFHFDAAEQIKNPGKLSNQMFLTIWGSKGSMVSIYSCLSVTCVGVWDHHRQLVCYASVPGYWKKGEWHHVRLCWGQALELSVDGQAAPRKEWTGLFGPVELKPEDLRLTFGSHIGWSDVQSEYALDEVRILGPGGDQVPDHPLMTVCRAKSTPVVDGTINDAEWAGAARTTGFVKLSEHLVAEEQTVVRATWDDEALYLAFDCANPTKRELIARLKERDSGVYMEDAVDFIARPEPDGYPYYHFICNAIGTVYDATMDPRRQTPADTGYNPNCVFRTSRQADRWQMECRLPFGELGGRAAPRDGERWRVNFCRDGETMNRYSSWSFAAGNFHSVARFGELVFSTTDRAIQLGPIGDLARGQVATQLTLTGFLFDPLVTVKGVLLGGDAKSIVEQSNRLADYRAVTIKAPPLVTGTYHLTVRATTATGPMYYQRLPFRVNKPYDVTAEGYPYEGKLHVTANIGGLTAPPAGLVARSRLLRGTEVVAECRAERFTSGLGAASLDIDRLAPGKYRVLSEAVAPDGQVLGSAEAEYEHFAKPAWWRNTIASDHSVPNPWTPVRADARQVSVLGRDYVGDGALPQQIINQGRPMLSGPVDLSLKVGGAAGNLARLPAAETARFADLVQRTATGAVGNVAVKVVQTTEFDGLQRYDLTLTPNGAAVIDELALAVPVRSPYAAFLCPSNGSTSPSLLVPKDGWKSSFLPQVWVGNDDLGLAWCAETDEFWRPHDDQMLAVTPAGETTWLRSAMVRQPLKLDRPVTFTFALMATPVKDAHAGDPFWYRFGEGQGAVQCQELCRYPGAGNVDVAQGTMELWFAPLAPMTGTWRQIATIAGHSGDLQLYYLPGPEQRLNIVLNHQGKQLSTGTTGLKLAPGEFAHAAVTWGDDIRLYYGGRRVATLNAKLPADWAKEPGKLGVRLGCPRDWNGYTRVAVDELRVSRNRRYPAESYAVPTAPFVKDADTLLLDHLDTTFRPDGEDAETRAEVISGRSGELGGVPSLGCRFGPGKFGGGLQIAMLDPMPRAEAVKRWGFNARLWWFWLEPDGSKYGWPSPLMVEPEVPKLRETLKEDTALGLRPSTYAIYPAVGSPSPLSAQFGHEWSRRPTSTQPDEPPKGHYFWDVCARSGWADYIVAGSQWLLDDVGLYALYTDGAAQAYACQNTHHGCGWTDEQGRVHPTWPVFPTREMLKRVYRLIHARHADGYLVNHMSFNTLIPTMSFTDVMYSGEHEQYENTTRFRVRWTGQPWGFWTVLLGGDAHIYESLHMTWSLLHGVSVWPQGWQDRNDMSRKTANLWLTYDRFGYRQAKWLPYYREQRLVRPDQPAVKASLYLIAGQRALVILGNTSHEAVAATAQLDLAAMGLTGATAVNALTDQPLALRDGTLSARLRPDAFVLAWVSAAGR